MLHPWEPTLLLALLALVVADRGLGLVRWYVVDGLLLATLALAPGVSSGLSWQLVWFWLCAAAVAADQASYVAGRSPRRDPFRLLGRARSWPVFALTSVVSAAVWAGALVGGGRLLGQAGLLWLVVLVAVLVYVLPRGRGGGQPELAGPRRR